MKKLSRLLTLLVLISPSLGYAQTTNTLDEQRAGIRKMENEVLAQLHENHPVTVEEIRSSAGYAVFSSGSLALLWVSGGYGHGIAHNNNTGEDVYMQMAIAGIGVGIGAKDYNTVFIFENQKAYNDFTKTGLDLTGTVDAAAKIGEKGDSLSGAADAIPGVRVYQMTDAGLVAQAMLQGTKYWRDDTLN